MFNNFRKEQVIESCKRYGFSDRLAEAFWKNKENSKVEDFYDFDDELYEFVQDNFHTEKTPEGEYFWEEVANGDRLGFDDEAESGIILKNSQWYIKIPKGLSKEKAYQSLQQALYADETKDQRIARIKKATQDEIAYLESLPEEEAKRDATEKLIKLGLINKDGSLSPNYYTEEQIAEQKNNEN